MVHYCPHRMPLIIVILNWPTKVVRFAKGKRVVKHWPLVLYSLKPSSHAPPSPSTIINDRPRGIKTLRVNYDLIIWFHTLAIMNCANKMNVFFSGDINSNKTRYDVKRNFAHYAIVVVICPSFLFGGGEESLYRAEARSGWLTGRGVSLFIQLILLVHLKRFSKVNANNY